MSSLPPIVMKRLALIKTMFNMASDQSKAAEPLSALSLLTFHDAVELFLELSADQCGVWRTGLNFLEYWELLRNSSRGIGLTQRGPMDALNRARVDFKHHGTMPSSTNIEEFRISTSTFLKENTPLVFGINFENISIVEIVTYENTRNSLKAALDLLNRGQFRESVEKSGLAFAQLIDDYEEKKRDQFHRSPFFFGESMTFLSSSFMGLSSSRERAERDLGEFVDKTKSSIESMREALKIVSLGLDFKRYTKFKLITPVFYETSDGNYTGHWTHDTVISKENAEYAFNYVIDCVLSLQDSD